MSEHCPQDGGFIGDAGCTHPNHQHSELVRGIMSGKASSVSEAEATAALWLLRKAYHIGVDVYFIICKMLGK